jgi:hypothetical protein
MIAAAAPEQLITEIPPSARGGNLTSIRCSTASGRVDHLTTKASRGDIETKSA